MLINKITIYPNSSQWAVSETHNCMVTNLRKLGIKVDFARFDIKTKYRYLNMRYQMNTSRQFLVPITPWQKFYFDYFHGGINNEIEFERNILSIIKSQKRIKGIRVIANIYKEILIRRGVNPNLIFKIPLSVNTDIYRPISKYEISNLKKELSISPKAHLIGSFQKDGSGWGEGLDPKLIKGPDILIKTLKHLKKEISEIMVILTGPSRGYVKEKLNEIGIEYRHLNADDISYRSKLYNILNAYLITSREEGGPNSFLEAMACGIPVVTTKVGHTPDIGDDQKDCFIANSFNPEDIADKYLIMLNKAKSDIKNNARIKALNYSYGKDLELWKKFFSI